MKEQKPTHVRRPQEARVAFPPHPLLQQDICDDWSAMNAVIAPHFHAITGRKLEAQFYFVSPSQLESDHDLMGVRGAVTDIGVARIARHTGSSLKSYGTFYALMFHELEHIDDQSTGFERFTNLLVDYGLLHPDDPHTYEVLYDGMEAKDPHSATLVDLYIFSEYMLKESRAQLFALMLSDSIFGDHPMTTMIAKTMRDELLGSAEFYSGGRGGFDLLFDRNILALLSIAQQSSVFDAWSLLGQPYPIVFASALQGLSTIETLGFNDAVIQPVNEFFTRQYGVRPYRFQYEWSGTSEELDSIASPHHEIHKRFSYSSKPEAFDTSARVAKKMVKLLR